MKKNKLAAGGAAVVMAAGIVITAVGSANAAPTTTDRITSVSQLHESLAQAVAQEEALGLQGTIGDPIGREVLQSPDAIDG
ncbi:MULTISPECIES: hypothetical protein [unclassified Streptomyces]|uniref:hypothetical protein n=1 Tax=unclassified Streptomyces TaxID=2593676 RepID=UPI001BE7E218|nr:MULTISPECIES: hypothetical protein [unclassified Streptomyces]MBT2407806.1 hypothetical protein [Streptomyces sp. ISL-21]MBT2456737.1 hypothetical protein [Streptomyces sp. ISL-86]MBT2608504.1 hypothetical protein [Streptomyces sp. ISL-87]